jgi:DNA-binding XRE family transcriptional regulator
LTRNEFVRIRHYLGKSQNQMAQLFGISLKTVQSFEQGLRKVPLYIERQALLLLAKKNGSGDPKVPCWERKNCDEKRRNACPAWEFQFGELCWFINGTICDGEVQLNWKRKMKKCKECEIFRSAMPALR